MAGVSGTALIVATRELIDGSIEQRGSLGHKSAVDILGDIAGDMIVTIATIGGEHYGWHAVAGESNGIAFGESVKAMHEDIGERRILFISDVSQSRELLVAQDGQTVAVAHTIDIDESIDFIELVEMGDEIERAHILTLLAREADEKDTASGHGVV